MNQNFQPEPTEIENIPPKPLLGILILVIGVLFIFPLSIIGFMMFILPGIGFLMIGIAMILEGIKIASGKKKLRCPYCGKSWVVSKRVTASKCPSCKKTGVLKNGYMTAID